MFQNEGVFPVTPTASKKKNFDPPYSSRNVAIIASYERVRAVVLVSQSIVEERYAKRYTGWNERFVLVT